MLVLTILLVLLAILAAVALFTMGVVGSAFWLLFGDLIVFGLIIWLIVTLIKRKK